MAIAIAGNGRNAHARNNFAKTLFDCSAVALRSARLEAFSLLKRKIGKYCARARRHQQSHVMGVNHLSGLNDKRDVMSARFDHRLPGCRQSQQCRQRRMIGVNASVGQNNETGIFRRRQLCVFLQAF